MYGKLKEQTTERGFFSVDSDWRFKHVNEKAADLLGEDGHTLVGENFWEEFPEAEGSVFENKTKEAVEEHRPVSFRWDYEPLDAEFCIQAHPSDGGLSVCFEDLTEVNAKKKLPGAELAARKSNETSEMRGSPLEELTERQRTVLRLAHESGFFESPREKTGQELADEMGITATTFHQHLRSAQKKMVRKILEVSD